MIRSYAESVRSGHGKLTEMDPSWHKFHRISKYIEERDSSVNRLTVVCVATYDALLLLDKFSSASLKL